MNSNPSDDISVTYFDGTDDGILKWRVNFFLSVSTGKEKDRLSLDFESSCSCRDRSFQIGSTLSIRSNGDFFLIGCWSRKVAQTASHLKSPMALERTKFAKPSIIP